MHAMWPNNDSTVGDLYFHLVFTKCLSKHKLHPKVKFLTNAEINFHFKQSLKTSFKF